MKVFRYFEYIYMEFNRIYQPGMIYDLHLERMRFTKVSDPSDKPEQRVLPILIPSKNADIGPIPMPVVCAALYIISTL